MKKLSEADLKKKIRDLTRRIGAAKKQRVAMELVERLRILRKALEITLFKQFRICTFINEKGKTEFLDEKTFLKRAEEIASIRHRPRRLPKKKRPRRISSMDEVLVWFSIATGAEDLSDVAADAARAAAALQVAKALKVHWKEKADKLARDFAIFVPPGTVASFFKAIKASGITAGSVEVFTDDQHAAMKKVDPKLYTELHDNRQGDKADAA